MEKRIQGRNPASKLTAIYAQRFPAFIDGYGCLIDMNSCQYKRKKYILPKKIVELFFEVEHE